MCGTMEMGDVPSGIPLDHHTLEKSSPMPENWHVLGLGEMSGFG